MPHTPGPTQSNQRYTTKFDESGQEESRKAANTGNKTQKKARRKHEPEAEGVDRESVLDTGSKGM